MALILLSFSQAPKTKNTNTIKTIRESPNNFMIFPENLGHLEHLYDEPDLEYPISQSKHKIP